MKEHVGREACSERTEELDEKIFFSLAFDMLYAFLLRRDDYYLCLLRSSCFLFFFVIRLELASSPDSMVFIIGVMISHNSVLPSMLSIAGQLEVIQENSSCPLAPTDKPYQNYSGSFRTLFSKRY